MNDPPPPQRPADEEAAWQELRERNAELKKKVDALSADASAFKPPSGRAVALYFVALVAVALTIYAVRIYFFGKAKGTL